MIVPEQAEIVRKIFSYAVNQGMGFQKIANSTRLDRREWTYAREQNPEITIVPQETWERKRKYNKEKTDCERSWVRHGNSRISS